MSIPITPRQIVAFKVADQTLALDIGIVREIKGWVPETPIPSSPAHVRGVVNLRGDVLAVYDMRVALGLEPTVATDTHVLVVIETATGVSAILADSVSDILDVPEGAAREAPPFDQGGGSTLVKGLIVLDSGIVTLIDPDAIQMIAPGEFALAA